MRKAHMSWESSDTRAEASARGGHEGMCTAAPPQKSWVLGNGISIVSLCKFGTYSRTFFGLQGSGLFFKGVWG